MEGIAYVVSRCTMVRFFLLSPEPSHSDILLFEHHRGKLDKTHFLQGWLLGCLLRCSHRHSICSGYAPHTKFHSGHGRRTSGYCSRMGFLAQTFQRNRLARISSSSFHRGYHLRCDHGHGFRLLHANARIKSKDVETLLSDSLLCLTHRDQLN